MRQHLSDEKVHYKLYKDGKNWVAASIATGIAIPVALFSAVFLSPVHEVQATSDDLGYTYTAGQSDLSNSEVADGIKAGTVYDATSNGSSTVKIDNTEIEKIAAAHLQLTLNGNTWSLSPDADFVKTSIDTVLTGLGYPTDAVSDPTSKTNAQSILDYLKKDGLQSVNGGSTAREDGNISWMVTPLISGSSLDMSGNQGGSINQADTLIGDTGFGAIIAGSLKVEDSDQAPFPTTNAQILLANHGYLNGTGSIPNGLINQLKQFSFADGSFASSMKRLQSATTQLMGLYSKTDGSAAVSFYQYNASTELDLDFSKAVKDANGDYVFTINSDTLKGNRYTFDWKNQAAYTGGNVIINYTGSSVINFQDTTNFKPDFLTGDNQIVLSVPNGNTINFTNADGPDQNHAVVLAPTSDVITNVGAYGGIVGAINGDGSNDGYDENTDPGNPINTNPKTPDTNVPDDPGNNPTKSTDTTKTPDDGGDTTTTTTSKTPESKAVTVNQTISTSVSDKDGIDPTDIPESDLPKNTETKSTTFTATVKDDGTVSYTNADGRISLEAPFNDVPVETTTKIGNTTYTVQVSGTLTDNSGLDEDTLDTKAVTDQIGQATDGTTLNWNISVVYFPSSTSKHKQVNFNNEVFFDYADDDFDSDPDNLPEDFTRTAVVSYVETTDSQGHSSYSDWQVEQSLDALTDANVPTMAGYRTNIENDITDDAIIGMLKSMGPINGASVTAETQVTYEKVVQLDDGIHVYTKAQQPGGVEQPSGTVGTNKPQGDPGDPLDTTDDDNNYVPDPDHVYTKAQQPGGVEQPSGTVGTNEPQGDPSDPLDTTDDNTNYVPDPDHVYTKAQQPGGVEQPSGTVGTNEPQGDPSDPLDTTDDDTNYVPDPDHV
ncbi:KxYKxGKxW signal peptide domain-containing protein, partial [Lacticaseibacillus manihotivorans]|uniref:KxYKxGKxW signal peptide domain-containing protein n=1 Tax=Lacticaseibacillus manihotivorans TaxID=88233 RepID=UPI0012E9255B